MKGSFYSGMALGKNNPYFEFFRDGGPFPQGIWKIGPKGYSREVGEYFRMIPLEVPGLDVLGYDRDFTSFLIHGDSRLNPGAASTGCLIMGPIERGIIEQHGGGRVIAVDMSVSNGAYLVGPSGYQELIGSRYTGSEIIGWSSGDVHMMSPGGEYIH